MFATLLLVLAPFVQDPVRSTPAELALEAGRRALAEGGREKALGHALAALELEPQSASALSLLLDIAAEDPDARTLWSHEAAAVLADAAGKFDPARDFGGKLMPKDGTVAALAAARAAAADELAEFASASRKAAERSVEAELVTGWAGDVGRELVHAAPALREQHAASFAPGFPLAANFRRATLDALEKRMASADASGDPANALRIALFLRGICAQGGFKDLEGPAAPDLTRARGAAEAVIQRSRARLADANGAPLTIEALEALDGDARDRFTREHADPARPGVALSPRGWYRVETSCGHGTLLGAASTVEDHHERLARWYGKDPFTGRPGLVRLVAESSGLESEGAPFFWVGGFQSGDVTTLRMAVGTIEGLGRGLTHELTHRFDGALYPGIPAWLAEGRAVWTGAAYADVDTEEFVANHASFGTIDDARYRGYGGRDALEKLVAGTIEDYRDNYVAGYALFVYLRTWYDEPEKPLFASRLEAYMKSRASDKRAALDAFVAWFCDGAEGRPKGFDAFAARFGEFVSGFYWRDRKPFTARYAESAGEAGTRWSDVVLDEPTWVWSRARAEPWLGQDQAREAGFLLASLGDEAGAIAAFGWSLAVDERRNSVDAALRGLLAAGGKKEGAWVLAHALERRGLAEASAGPAPMLARLDRLRALLEEYRRAIAFAESNGRTIAAAALAADHDRLAGLVGAPLASQALRVAAPADLASLHPFDEPRRALVPRGFVEDKLVDYDRRRVAGLWCVDERANLHVGRATPRAGTGDADRASHQRDAFVRSKQWNEPGRWRVRLRLAPTTAYFSGAIVVGYERRDRQARFSLSGGDYAFAIGDKEEPAELDSIGWNLGGLYERDGGLPGATRGGSHGFGRTVSSFELELAVDGGALHAFVDGEYLGTYHTPDGMPIEGYVGFATSVGSYRVSQLSVQRLDRSAIWTPLERVPPPILLDRPRVVAFRDATNRRVVGLPLDLRGTLCAWLPLPETGEDGRIDEDRAVRRMSERARDLQEFVLRFSITARPVLALSAALGPDLLARVRAALDADLDPDFRARLAIVEHGPPDSAVARATAPTDSRASWLLFVDSAGVLRGAESLSSDKRLDGTLSRWIRVFANR